MSLETTIPPWPSVDPVHGSIRLRRFTDRDAEMAVELSQDEYIPTIGTLPPHATFEQGLEWVKRQRQHHQAGTGFSFSIADAETDRSMGNVGLWVRELDKGRAQAGYGVVPSARGRRIASSALKALLDFAWTIPSLHRMELYIEPWNVASTRTAELAGFNCEGLLRSHQEISGERCDMLIYATIRAGSSERAR